MKQIIAMHFLAREKEEGRGGGAHRGGARRPCDSLVATEVAGVEEDSGDPRKKRWRGRAPSRPGSAARRPGVEADSARRLACRLARWSSRAGKAREGVDWERTAMGGRAGADWGRRRRRRRGGGGGVGRGSARVDLVARERGSKGIWRGRGRIARGKLTNGAPHLGAPLEIFF